jgi:hypothetical protein
MTAAIATPEFHLHFEGENPLVRAHKVPAAALLQAVQALQRVVHLLALNHEGHELKQRLRVSRQIESKYAVVFGVPQDGGYDLPYTIGNPSRGLLDPQDLEAVIGLYSEVLRAVEGEDVSAFRRAVPAAHLRRAIATELKKMQPPLHMGLYVNIEASGGQKLLSGKTVTERLNPLISEASPSIIQPRIVTGRLDALEFRTRTLKIQLPSGKFLNCTYSEDFEPVLVENRREWIQVRGEAALNDDDTLKALNNVSEIIEVDDSPIEVTSFQVDGRTLTASRAITIPVKFDPEEGRYTAESEFHLMVTAETRDELEEEVNATLVFLWREYAEANQQRLSLDARLLSRDLHTIFGAQ